MSPRDAWDEVARRPDVHDAEFLGRALTLARLESSLSEQDATRARFDAAHDAIWQKMRAGAPPPTDSAKDAPRPPPRSRGVRRR